MAWPPDPPQPPKVDDVERGPFTGGWFMGRWKGCCGLLTPFRVTWGAVHT